MKKLLLLIAIGIFVLPELSEGQIIVRDEKVGRSGTFKKGAFASLLGPNLLVGVNFDMRLQRGVTNGIGFRVGVGGGSISDYSTRYSFVTFPMGINYLAGRRASHFIIEGGLLPVYVSVSSGGAFGEGMTLAGGYAAFGYRYQSVNSGFLGQITWNPLITRGAGFQPAWLEIGLGASF